MEEPAFPKDGILFWNFLCNGYIQNAEAEEIFHLEKLKPILDSLSFEGVRASTYLHQIYTDEQEKDNIITIMTIYKLESLSKTVYSIMWSNTKNLYSKYKSLEDTLTFTETWSKKQDLLHIEYLHKWKNTFSNYVQFNNLNHSYPTNGSSEAILNQLVYLNTLGKKLVVFEEEYEGYKMMAYNIGMPIQIISRNLYREYSFDSYNEVFFLSQPSSIDGNIWNEFNQFLEHLQDSKIEVYIDFAYLGSFNSDKIDLTPYENISGIFFSLSKVFGVYYHRIGGCFLKAPNPLLYPMLWFKNLMSISFGNMLLDSYSNGEYEPQKMINKEYQKIICEELSTQFDISFIPSDVPFIAMIKYTDKLEWIENFKRSPHSENIRICISQLLETKIKNELC